ncbi:MAG TPA: SusC/RagA family TonB-linked outer membrane protein [Gemmatimonadaceae bacterium]|nr:SusC/RagA family TonB-linked outer membrane protein [Gemmatimonadaceae bacterium]
MSTTPIRQGRPISRLLAALTFACVATALGAVHNPLRAQGGAERITGTVSAEGGVPLADVRVSVNGTQLGAMSGADGRFAIAGLTAGTYTVRAQRIGYAPQTRNVTVIAGQGGTANFQLQAVAAALSEVVSVGYTTQSRATVSDAVATVSAADIADQKVTTIEDALHGRVAGVQVTTSGEPGRAAQISIRGQSFLGNITPLYVVDGMYLGENTNIDPQDIESIEILKDASAAAQYGAQAANGVIVIKTKRGRQGANRVELRSYYGYQDIPKRIDMMNSTQWAEITRQAYTNAGMPVPAGAINPTVNTDWQSALFQTGAIQNHNLQVSGGTPTASYLLGGGFTDQTGTVITTGFRRYNFRINSELRRSRLLFGEAVALSHSNRRSLNGFPLVDALRMVPTIPVRDPGNPSGYGYGSDANPTFGSNPVGLLEQNENRYVSNQVIGTAYAQATILPNLHYRFNLGANYNDFQGTNWNGIAQLRYRSPNPVARLTDRRDGTTALLFENLLTFDDQFRGADHKVNAVVGYTEQRTDFARVQAYREGFSNESLREINAGLTAGQNNSGFLVPNRLIGMLVRGSYSFRDRYLLTLSGRRDGSSRFGPANRYGNFAAGSVGWVLSEEPFFKALPVAGAADLVKLRASMGSLGNQDIGDFQYTAPITSNRNYIFGGQVSPGATQLVLANPYIKWQNNRESNLGLDIETLGRTLTFSADYYVRTSDGLLVSAPIPWSLGAEGSPVVNAGAIRNAGVELSATHVLERGKFKLNTNANVATLKNRVLRLGNGNQPIFAGPWGVSRTAVGGPVGEFYVKKMVGIFQSDAEAAASAQPGARAGDVKYADLNGDGIINDQDRYNAGSGIPKLTGGLFLNSSYAALDFGVNLRGSWGAKIFNVPRFWTDRMDDLGNYRADLRPWTPQNHSNTTPRAVFGAAGAANADPVSSRWLENGDYVKIQNIQVGFRIPARYLQRVGTQGFSPRVYVNVQNLHTFTSFTNWDPEALGFGDPLSRGVDDGYIYPNVRTVSFGIDLSL